MPTIFVNAKLAPQQLERLRSETKKLGDWTLALSSAGNGSNLLEGPSEPDLLAADVAFGQPSVTDMLAAKNLKFVQLTSAGWDRYDTEEMRAALKARGAVMANASRVYAQACAEHALAFMLAATRLLPVAMENQYKGQGWSADVMRRGSQLLTGKTVLLVGYGAIAAALIDLLAPFKMKVKAVRRTVRGDEKCKTYPIIAVDELLPDADHVMNILPGGEPTTQFFDARRFHAMKKTAVFYNIGRGSTVDQYALQATLQTGHLAGAYLDVTTPEPLPKDHALWTTPRCHITPHTAGGYDREFDAQVDHFLVNLRNFVSGTPVNDRVI